MPRQNSLSYDDIINLTSVAKIVTVDTEGFDLLLGISLCFDGLAEGFYLPFSHVKDNLTTVQQKNLFKVLSSREALVFHNAMHDLRVLRRAGFEYRGKFYDTMLMAHWINEERYAYDLTSLSVAYGGKPKNMGETATQAIIESEGWNAVSIQQMIEYSGNDALITHALFCKLLPEFIKQKFDGDLWANEQEFIRDCIGPMIDLGVKVDLDFSMKQYMRGLQIQEDCKNELGINPGSSKDLEKLLIDELGLPVVKRTPTGKISFAKEAMTAYEIMLERKKDTKAQVILRYRGWNKTCGANYKSYIHNADASGVIHPGYMLHRTVTSRLACEKPALQQIPKASDKEWNGNLKSAFIPRAGYEMWTVDYSQLQFRMAVSYANQLDLIEIFNDPNRDIFSEMASGMGWLRSDVKTLVYLILFGGGATRASLAFGVSTEQGRELVNEFHTLYPNIKKVAKEAQYAAQKMGYISFWTGRRRHFPKSKNSAYYRAFNAAIQGGEAEVMKHSMIALKREVCNNECRMVLQIHDELAFEIKIGYSGLYLPKIQKTMQSVPELSFCNFTGVNVKFPTEAKEWGKK